MSTAKIYRGVLKQIRQQRPTTSPIRHLDVGAGAGQLIRLLRDQLQCESSACDYSDHQMKLPDQKVDLADLNHDPLPYPDGRFDVVTASEVVEHIEHYRATIREFYRVLKPGGLCVLTTPNILNLNSRLRFFAFGFWNLFGPLPVKHAALETTGGHINPVSFFYLAHALLDAGFVQPAWSIDKRQRSAMAKLIVFWLPIRLLGKWSYRVENTKYRTIHPSNEGLVRAMNSLPMLLGRTLIVSATKP